jgi:glycine reductase
MDEMSPATISPLHVLDGAIVGNFVMPSINLPTSIRIILIEEMFRRHGKTLSFRVILSNEMSRLDEKQKAVQGIFELIMHLKVSGVIINQEGGANTLTDVMMLCAKLEPQGIKTVLVLNEFAGSDGTTPSLAETTPPAEHIVSAGNNDYRLTLPAVEICRMWTFPGVGVITGAIVLPLTRVHSSTNQLGSMPSCRTDGTSIFLRILSPTGP